METESRYIVQVSHSFVFSFITSKNEYTSNIVGISDQYMFDSIFKLKFKSLIDLNVFQRNDHSLFSFITKKMNIYIKYRRCIR